ncbi:MAG: DNA-directed RNA polymerase subunit alpha [Thermoanaerobaculia bacterium]
MPINFQMPKNWKYDKKTITPFYAHFIAQPFERGWATTIGNSLRRILFSSIPSAAITAVRIKGVKHEFSTIPGVKEDVTHILLNLKKIPIILYNGDEKIIHLKAEGYKEVKAGDFDPDSDIKIVDPKCHIATLDTDGELELWCRVKRAKGYVNAEDNKESELDIDFLYLDSIHSPVKKVNFIVSPARVGRLSIFEKLELQIWTDGTISPLDALREAVSLLSKHLEIFSLEPEPYEEDMEIDLEKQRKKEAVVDDPLDRPIDELDISTRAINCLKNNNVETLRDLIAFSEKDLEKIKNFGKKSLTELLEALKKMGFSLSKGSN